MRLEKYSQRQLFFFPLFSSTGKKKGNNIAKQRNDAASQRQFAVHATTEQVGVRRDSTWEEKKKNNHSPLLVIWVLGVGAAELVIDAADTDTDVDDDRSSNAVSLTATPSRRRNCAFQVSRQVPKESPNNFLPTLSQPSFSELVLHVHANCCSASMQKATFDSVRTGPLLCSVSFQRSGDGMVLSISTGRTRHQMCICGSLSSNLPLGTARSTPCSCGTRASATLRRRLARRESPRQKANSSVSTLQVLFGSLPGSRLSGSTKSSPSRLKTSSSVGVGTGVPTWFFVLPRFVRTAGAMPCCDSE